MADIPGFHHVALTVRDCDSSGRWYRDVFGFVERFREDGDERRARVLGFAGGGVSVGLVEHRDGTDDGFDPRRRGLDHLAFTVSTREELDRWAERLTARDITHSGVIDVPPGAILNFRDPDGISLALFWDRPQVVE